MREPGPSLTRLTDLIARRTGDDPAVLADDTEGLQRLSSGELSRRIDAVARGLVAGGATRGERIGLFAPPSLEWIAVRLGIGAAGAVAVPIDPLASTDEAAMIVGASGTARLFTTASQLPLLDDIEAPTLHGIIVMDEAEVAAADHGPRRLSLRELTAAAGEAVALPNLSGAEPAMMVFTSGTTGAPKYFTLSYDNIEANVRAIAGTGLIGGNDRLLVPLPLHHVYPFVVGVLVPLWTGAVIVLPQAAQGPAIVRALERSAATMMIGVPRLYQALVAGIEAQARARGPAASRLFKLMLGLSIEAKRRLGVNLGRRLFGAVHARFGGSMRLMVSAGAKLEAPVIWTIEGLGFELLTGYGLAETASAFTGNVPGAKRIGSEGRPLSGGQARIAALADAEALPDADGEIQLKGPSVFAGYLDNPDANAQAFTGDGWFRTGDLGSIDADGFVYVTGRAKEMIVLGGGKNVFPEDLERIYGETPYFTEIAVLERDGDLVALIVPDLEKIRADGYASLDDVVRVALSAKAHGLASHQRLSGYAISREPLPRTRLGKYQRFLLPQLYDRALKGETRPTQPPEPSDEDKTLLADPTAAAAWAVMRERYAEKRLSMDASPQLDLGIDSLEWLGLGMALEAATGRTLEPERMAGAETVRELILLTCEAPAGEATTAGALEPSAAARAQVAADAERWLAPTKAGTRAFGAVLAGLNRLLVRGVFRLRVEGVEGLPAAGSCILVANHASDLDPPALSASLPWEALRRVYWSGDRGRLFASALSRRFCRAVHIFPVDERAPGATLAMAEEVLARGNCLVWFPESWRTPDGKLQRFRPGIGALLLRRPVPLVPTWIDGTFEALPRTKRLPKPHPLRVRFGAPIDPASLVQAAGGDPIAIASRLRDEVAALAPGARSGDAAG
ncbi:MAG: AMP-binding protein [Rhodospirillales bacterium]|nr:AMP-binding protein [Rhodospirillales bacterium]